MPYLDMVIVDVDQTGSILNPDLADLEIKYPQWAEAKRVALSVRPLKPGSIFTYRNADSPSFIVAASIATDAEGHTSFDILDETMLAIGESARMYDAQTIAIAHLGSTLGMRRDHVLDLINAHLDDGYRTIRLLTSLGDLEPAALFAGDLLPPAVPFPITFVSNRSLYRIRLSSDRSPGAAARGYTLDFPETQHAERATLFTTSLVCLGPADEDDQRRLPHAVITPAPVRASHVLGDPLLQAPVVGVHGPELPLAWNDPRARAFLMREAREMARYKDVSPSASPTYDPHATSGLFYGELLWCNEGFLLQRVADRVIVHAIERLDFEPSLHLRLRRPAFIAYHDGRGRVYPTITRFASIAQTMPTFRVASGEEDGVPLNDPAAPWLRYRGFSVARTELMLGLLSRDTTRRAFARLLALLRRDKTHTIIVTDHSEYVAAHAIVDVLRDFLSPESVASTTPAMVS